MNRFERARWWLGLGASLVPLQPRSKRIVAGYGAHQQHLTTEADVRYWFADRVCNVGLVLDKFVCADFDQAEAFDEWRAGPGRNVDTLIEATARGVHVYWRASEGLTSCAGPGCEFKAGGVVMVAPSAHPSDVVYQIVHDVAPLQLSAEQAMMLFPFIRRSSTAPELRKGKTRRATVPSGGDLVSRIKAAWRIEQEAAAAGVELRPARRGEMVGRCPFHSDQEPSLWLNVERQRWGCYSLNCPTNSGSEQAHDVINFRAYWRHAGNVRAAIAELAGELGLS